MTNDNESESIEHRLSAILLADIVSFSKLMDADEEATYAAVRASRKEVAEPAMAKHHGRFVKFTGDGFLAEFPTVHDALNFAIQSQKEMYQREKDKPEESRIVLRIGINLGDIIVDEDGDIFGDGVNVAARLEGLANPGGICVSGTVYELVRKSSDLPFIDLGRQEIKNIKSGVRAYDVDLGDVSWPPPKRLKPMAGKSKTPMFVAAAVIAGLLATVSWQFMSGPSQPETVQQEISEQSVAVLPFVNMSSDPEQEYFSDGITEEILDDLTKIQGLKVTARTSAFSFKDKNIPIPEIAKALGVANILEGSVRKAGNKVRITAQLIRATDGFHIWSDTYDGDLSDVFKLQDDISANISSVLKVKLLGGAKGPAAGRMSGETSDPEAHDLYLKGLQNLQRPNLVRLRKALQQFKDAIRLDNDYLMSYAMAGEVIVQLVNNSGASPSSLEEAEVLARKALAIDPGFGQAYATLGSIANEQGEPALAMQHLERAIALGDENSTVKTKLGLALALNGNYDRALAIIDEAIAQDPLNWRTQYSRGKALYYKGDIEGTLDAFQKIISIDQQGVAGYWLTGVIEGPMLGHVASSIRNVEKSVEISTVDPEGPALLSHAYLALGNETKASQHADAAWKVGPSVGFAAHAKVHIRLTKGEFENARNLALAVLADPDAIYRRGSVIDLETSIVRSYFEQGAFDQAEAFLLTRYPTALALLKKEAATSASDLAPVKGNVVILQMLANIFRETGRSKDAESLSQHMAFIGLPEIHQVYQNVFTDFDGPRREFRSNDHWVMSVAKIGTDKGAAFAHLEKSIEMGFLLRWRFHYKNHPALWSLRDEPRYKALIKTIEAKMAIQRKLLVAS